MRCSRAHFWAYIERIFYFKVPIDSPYFAEAINSSIVKIVGILFEQRTWISLKSCRKSGREKIKAFVKKINLLGILKNRNKNQ